MPILDVGDGLAVMSGPADQINEDAIAALRRAFDANPTVGFVYGDTIGPDGNRIYHPPWSLPRLRSTPYVQGPVLGRRSLIDQLPHETAKQRWETQLQLAETGPGLAITDVVATRTEIDTVPTGHGVAVVQAHLDRIGHRAKATASPTGMVALHRQTNELISLVIPTGGATRLVPNAGQVMLVEHGIRSVIERSTHRNFEFVVVVDALTPAHVRSSLEQLDANIKFVSASGPFDFSARINLGALAATGDHIVMYNDDVEVLRPEWLELMLAQIDPADATTGSGEAAAIGARLLYADNRIQHAGVVLADTGPAHAHRGLRADHPGDNNELLVTTDIAAVTGACLLTTRRTFQHVGGLTSQLPINYNDVDYCLKLADVGQRTVVVPDAVLIHHESVSRGVRPAQPWETDRFRDRWDSVWGKDPHRNPELVNTTDVVFPVSSSVVAAYPASR